MSTTFFTVGVIVNMHGLRGEVKVLSRTDFPETRFRPKSKLSLRKPGQPPHDELTIRTARPHKGVWLVTFEGRDHIDDVESLRGLELCIHASQLERLPEGTYYHHQLLGLSVIDDTGKAIGTIRDILTPGANDVYVVKTSLQKSDLLLPAIPDCILGVDLAAGTMMVRLLPGLLEDEVNA